MILMCEATGEGTLNYQWRKVIGSLPNRIMSSDNNQTLNISRISTNDNGKYYCEVDNGGASLPSNRVQVSARGEFLHHEPQ